jgi:hypothetical protein
MVTISITADAFAGIEATLADGYEAEARPDGKGGYLVTLPHDVLNRLKAMRGPGGARALGAPRLLGVRRHSRSLRPRQHALEHGIAFDEPMVERARDMEREDHTDQNPADEMPDVNAI